MAPYMSSDISLTRLYSVVLSTILAADFLHAGISFQYILNMQSKHLDEHVSCRMRSSQPLLSILARQRPADVATNQLQAIMSALSSVHLAGSILAILKFSDFGALRHGEYEAGDV